MTSSIRRRAFIAATTLAVPALVVGSATGQLAFVDDHSPFSEFMDQANKHLKSMRTTMRTLNEEEQFAEAAFTANQVTILLAKCIETAGQAPIPERLQSQYAGKESDFVREIRLQLADCASASIALSKALWLQDSQAAKEHYKAIRSIKKMGHEEFTGD